jgi:hypothetical protein
MSAVGQAEVVLEVVEGGRTLEGYIPVLAVPVVVHIEFAKTVAGLEEVRWVGVRDCFERSGIVQEAEK